MKKIIAVLAVSILALTGAMSAMADSQAGALSGSQAGASNTSNLVNVDARKYNSVAEATDMGNMVPAVYAPGLTTSGMVTCMGSTSAGGSGSGFGLSFGSTWIDENCERRLDAGKLAELGYADASMALMCGDTAVWDSMELTGHPCPNERPEKRGKPLIKRVLKKDASGDVAVYKVSMPQEKTFVASTKSKQKLPNDIVMNGFDGAVFGY